MTTVYSEELFAIAKELGNSEGSVNALNQLSGIALQQGAMARLSA